MMIVRLHRLCSMLQFNWHAECCNAECRYAESRGSTETHVSKCVATVSAKVPKEKVGLKQEGNFMARISIKVDVIK